MHKKIKQILFILFAVAVCFAVIGKASSDTSSYPIRGEGRGEISGYAVSDLRFRLGEDPAAISAVEFDLDAPASQVLISFDSPSNQVFSCSNPAGYHWVCQLKGVKTGEVKEIQISAVG